VGDYTVAGRGEALDIMAEYPGYGEMLSYTGALGAEQVALTWRRMPAGTGGKGSYGHRHNNQEELYLVLSGEVQAKIGDDVITLGPGMAVRVPPTAYRSIHNDGPGDAELVICSVRVDDPQGETEVTPDFWPEDVD
jgi:mannose-6-phosphate isomerase-like protein (cupin superfamily)